MSRLLIRAHSLLTQSPRHGTVRHGALLVEEGVIRQIGPLAELEGKGPFDQVLGDPERHIALPGFVNSHHHSLRPTRIGLPAAPLETWLVRSRLRNIPLTPEQVYDHTLWGTLQLLKSGVTSVIDHLGVDWRMDDLGVPESVQAYRDAGMRAAICVSCADQQQLVYDDNEAFLARLPAELNAALRPRLRPFDAGEFFARWERLAARLDGADGLIRIGFGPGGPQWCSDELLRRIRATADDHNFSPVQIHLLESRYQAMYGYLRYSGSAVAHLNELGFFGPATSGAHCVWPSSEDVRLLAANGTVLVHNPSSNMILSNGIAPVADFLAAGVNVGFGLDAAGFADTLDVLTDLRLALLLQRRPGVRRSVSPSDLLAMATHAGAEALSMGENVGRLQAGYKADVALVDRSRLYGTPYVSPTTPAEDVLVQRGIAADVEHVVVGGRPVVIDRKPVGIDEAALERRIGESMQGAGELLRPAEELFAQLEPHVAAFYRDWEARATELLPPYYQYNTR
jgi:5-methylthioadenosine/S-adenosylhomocysteine deaminase